LLGGIRIISPVILANTPSNDVASIPAFYFYSTAITT